MPLAATVSPRLLGLARRDQVAMLFTQLGRTTASMALGAIILCAVMWEQIPPAAMGLWFTAIVVIQASRWRLVHAYRRAFSTTTFDPIRWGRYWAWGSFMAGVLFGCASLLMFNPISPNYEALLIVCLFGVVLGGVNLTAVFKPSFYGFVIPALLPLIVRVALEGDKVHVFTACVMMVVLAFILRFGNNLNNLLTQSLAIRHENQDLIGELKQQKITADEARGSAEAANRTKTQFLAAASHDLRQPLHAMGLFAATLASKARDPEVRDLVGSINDSVEALEGLFSELMDISKLDAGGMQPQCDDFPLQPLFERIALDLKPLAQEKGLRFSVVPTSMWVRSDPMLLERILRNLATNAVRYTSAGGVVVGVRRTGHQLRIDVCDSGIGISDAEQAKIFDEFYQIGNPERQSKKGMGLGLAIIRRLSLLLDHPIEVRSAPGRGSRFSITLPRASRRAKTLGEAHPELPSPQLKLAGKLIAIVDDEASIVAGMRALFTTWGCEVVGATSGDALLAALGEIGRYPDLIIADYRLGAGEDGFQLIARIRDELGYAVPGIIVTASTATQRVPEAEAAGLDILFKPVVTSALRDLVSERLGQNSIAAIA